MPDALAWWQRAPIYQVYPRSFCDANGDGVGDLAGIGSRLGHVRRLGCGGVWLSPFYPSPMADFGYDICDYTDVDPLFGTLADFDALFARAREERLEVIVDWVGNHSSDRHPWFEASRADRKSDRRDWYVWRDGRGPGEPPNNWETAWKEPGPAWEWDERTAQWYLHSFLAEQPDLNWDNPEVGRAMSDVLRFWIDRGAAGFRLDAVFKVGKDPLLGDDEPGLRHGEHWPVLHERLRRLRRVVDERGVIAVGEIYADTQEQLLSYVNPGDELHMVHNFELVLQPWDAAAYRRVLEDFAAHAAPHVWPAWCLNNHDHSRVASRFDDGGRGAQRARVAAMLLMTLRGTPFLYQGEELGLRDADVPPELAIDVDGRDPERAPIPWEPGRGHGFTSGEPWLPFPPDAERLNAAAQAAEPGSTLSLYRELIALRARTPALLHGAQELLDAGDGVLAYAREREGERFVVALNFSSEEAPLPLGDVVLRTGDGGERLGPDEGAILAAR